MDRTRCSILAMLKAAPEIFLSGEEISGVLEISRAAVWKQVNRLRLSGYVIEAHPRLGYRLVNSPDLLLPEEIFCGLDTCFMGQNIVHFDTVGSTNNEAYRLGQAGAPEGTAVIAEEQTAGKGRRGRSWHSPARKGLWLSLLLYPKKLLPAEVAPLTAVAGVAAAAALRQATGYPVSIKWPNDLLLSGRKVTGILAELKAEIEQVHFVILGLGVNINQEPGDFPPELQQTATSFRIEGNRLFDRRQVCIRILEEMEKAYLVFLREGFAPFRETWKELSATLGEEVTVTYDKKELRGTAVDLDETGALIVEDSNRKLHRVDSGIIG